MDVAELFEREAIGRLKHKYMRCVDQKLWDEIVDCFTEDVAVSYDSGRYRSQGRDTVVEFLRRSMPATKLTSHRAHQPEIELTGAATAEGVWAMDDAVIDTVSGTTIRGAGFYEDRYVKVDGAWKIQATGYQRTYMEVHRPDAAPGSARRPMVVRRRIVTSLTLTHPRGQVRRRPWAAAGQPATMASDPQGVTISSARNRSGSASVTCHVATSRPIPMQ